MSRVQPRVFDAVGEAREFVHEQTLAVVLGLALGKLSEKDGRCGLWRLGYPVA